MSVRPEHARRGGSPHLGEKEFRDLFDEVRTWHRWDDGRIGGLHHLTPARVAAAAGEVRLGRQVPLGLPLQTSASPDNPEPPVHHMTGLGDVPLGSGALRFATDYVGMNVHGDAHTHIDALCHVVFDGRLYDGISAGTLTAEGAGALAIDVAGRGLVGRGVLLDVARVRKTPWLEPGEAVTVEDLEAAERAQGIRVGPGDILCVRVGHRRRRNALGAWDVGATRAGVHPLVARYLSERRVAVLGSDSNNDAAPSAVTGVPFPLHVLAINAMGLHLLDYLDLEELSRFCAEANRWSFFCLLAPLRLVAGTGSPVNPIAVF
jgi:kynurenine formamidase